MYKCDKCGCEHTSRTVCPKCGAPVIIVNEDYLLRRKQWEEQQKNNLRYKKKGERENSDAEESLFDGTSINIGGDLKSREKRADNKSGGNRNSDNDFSEDNNINVKEKILEFKNNLFEKIRDKKSALDEEKKKKEKEKNANDLKDNRREQKIKEKRRKIIMSTAVAVGIIVVAGGIFAGVKVYKSIDGSDLRYFDGHELISVDEGVLFDLDREEINYSLLTYTSNLNAAFLRNIENTDSQNTDYGTDISGDAQAAVGNYTSKNTSFLGWYDGKEYELVSDIGDITDEYMFSESGRYLAYVLYSEGDEKYFLVIYDLLNGENIIYDTDVRIKLVAVNNGGSVLFNEIDTGDYSTVVGMNFYVADLSKKLLIADNVSDTDYDKQNEKAVFVKEDTLYVCDVSDTVMGKYEDIISDKEHIFVNEGVGLIVDNVLDKAVLYMTDAGLWIYENGQSHLAADAVDASGEFYYDGEGNLYYKNRDKLYYIKLNWNGSAKKSKSNAGESLSDNEDDLLIVDGDKPVQVLDGISGDVVDAGDGSLWCVAQDGILLNVRQAQADEIDTNVTGCIRLLGRNGCAYVKDGNLIFCYGKGGKNKIICDDIRVNEISDFSVIISKKYLYYVDSSSVLWKIAKNGKERESLGFASLIGIFDDK